MNVPIEWLLEGEPFIEYRTRVDLLGQSAENPSVRAARQAMLDDPRLRALLDELSGWPGTVISSHKSSGQLFHKLTFVADLGLQASDPEMDAVIGRVMSHQSAEGPFSLPMAIPTQYGGTGEERWAWALCDAPLLVYALVKFGLEELSEVQRALSHLRGLVRDNGWPCAVSKELGKFRGPGRKGDPCPFANLAMLKVLSVCDNLRDGTDCRIGIETLLSLWDESTTRHPYMFFMGTDFRKIKTPFVWYDILHVLDVLSRFAFLRNDARLLDMVAVLRGKANDAGRFAPASVWTAWQSWEFGQKREPSRWLTLMAWRILKRFETE